MAPQCDYRRKSPKKGDYVLATKYGDGDPGDHFCVGFYDEPYNHCGEPRHLVLDANGKQFRANGFRRVALIGAKRGEWIVEYVYMVEKSRYSLWHWYRAPWRELHAQAAVWDILARTQPKGRL